MKIGFVVAQNYWIHLNEIYKEIANQHTTQIYQERQVQFQLMSERANRFLRRNGLARFMKANDLTFFEWGEDQLVTATHLPASSLLIARLHLHELWDFAPQVNWENVDWVIFISHAMERKFLTRFPEMAGRTCVIHNGVSLKKFQHKPHPFKGVIGTLNRIEPHKGIWGLIIALYQLRKQGYDLTLHIGGVCNEPRYQRYNFEVHHLVERLNLQPYVKFQGYIEDTPAWFQDIDIFVSNSCSEGLQVALLEAMASGCYCLSHFWDGADEALPVDNIYITEAELLEKIKVYCNLPESAKHQEQERMRTIAVEKFDIDQKKLLVCQTVEEVYSKNHSGRNGRK